jgi:transmembrane sensor
VWLVAAAAALAAILFFVVRRDDAGPLYLAGGARVVELAAASEPHGFALSDGSRVDLAPGATFAPRENSSSRFEGTLRGVAMFDVHPGGPRRWTIDCGLATVEVIGTKFEIDARDDRVHVRVDRGRVRVKSARGGVAELGAGESFDTGPVPVSAPALAPVPVPVPAPPPEPPPSVSSIPPPEAPSAKPATDDWQALARKGDYAQAYDKLGAPGIARATPKASVDELLALADVARLSGHPADAVAPLGRVIAENPKDTRAPLAAFTLGRLELDTLGRPAPAAEAFARAIALGLPANLVEDAYARLVEARAKAGDPAGAQAAADEYDRAFPGGSRSTTMRRWLGGSPSPSQSP